MTLKFQVSPTTKPPKRLVKSPRLTIEQMFKNSTRQTLANAKNVRVLSMREMRTPKSLEGYTTYRLETVNLENGHKYNVTVFSPTARVSPDTKLLIDSPCPLFVFRYEYALAKRGNALIYRSNGDVPSTTNPRLTPGLCHHSIAALRFLVKNTRKTGVVNRGQR